MSSTRDDVLREIRMAFRDGSLPELVLVRLVGALQPWELFLPVSHVARLLPEPSPPDRIYESLQWLASRGLLEEHFLYSGTEEVEVAREDAYRAMRDGVLFLPDGRRLPRAQFEHALFPYFVPTRTLLKMVEESRG